MNIYINEPFRKKTIYSLFHPIMKSITIHVHIIQKDFLTHSIIQKKINEHIKKKKIEHIKIRRKH